MADVISLSSDTFRQFRDFIYDRTGIFIPDTKKYLVESRLQKRLQEKNLRSFEDYLCLLRYDATEARNHLFNLITTRETSFFREPMLLDAFGQLLDKVLSERRGGGLNIWSAGCSTGEEPYTLAMMIHERTRGTTNARILATDISSDAIASAKRAIYGDYALRSSADHIREKYFEKASGGLTPIPEVRRLVRFEEVNLLDSRRLAAIRGMDFIFCRNVMIYFDMAVKQKVVSCFYDSLTADGYFFVGASESLHMVSRIFKPLAMNKTVVYMKG